MNVIGVRSIPIPFDCPKLPVHPPATNARELRADDISMVMAIGDSMTAAFAAYDNDPITAFLEYRAESWAIGANPDSLTVYNLINYFNPSAVCGAMNNTIPFDVLRMKDHDFWETNFWPSRCDAAVSEAQLRDIGEQIDYLGNMSKIYFPSELKGWKLLIILIGANDLCASCPSVNSPYSDPTTWLNMYDGFLEQIHEALPNTFVAITSLLNISIVWDAMMAAPPEKEAYCMVVRKQFHECGCLDSGLESDRAAMDLHTVAYNQGLQNLAEQWQAKNLSDFYVSVQPFLEGLVIPNMTFLSGLDCFHPSWQAHQAFAVTMWNSLFLPQDKKPVVIQLNNDLYCPTLNDYLQ